MSSLGGCLLRMSLSSFLLFNNLLTSTYVGLTGGGVVVLPCIWRGGGGGFLVYPTRLLLKILYIFRSRGGAWAEGLLPSQTQ